MRDRRQIVERWHQGAASILATLIRVQGSSYRQAGARLLVCKDGTYEGSISAGCLEADLLRKAAWLVRDGSVIERYSTLFDGTAEIPFGLGCGGVLDVLLEPVDTPECQALLKSMASALEGCEQLVATWLPAHNRPLMRSIFHTSGEVIFASDGLPSDLLFEARTNCMRNANSSSDELFTERLLPPQRLFVFGAGDDAKPLVTMASLLGWHVTVIDGRANLARKARFPEDTAEVISAPAAAVQTITFHDAVVLMTHSYEQDREYLTSVLPLAPRYLGLLGSRERSAHLIADVAAKLDLSISECCGHICAPAGMDIGAEGPEAISLAILAEAQAYCMGKHDLSRKLSAKHVDRYLGDSDSRGYSQTQCSLDAI